MLLRSLSLASCAAICATHPAAQALEEARIAKLDDEVRQAEERWQSVQKKLSGKELERALAAGKQEAP